MRPALVLLPLLLLLSACADPGSAVGFNEPDPAARIRAVRQAARSDDRSSIRSLIERLESDDAAERLVAIHTLERLTGKTHGYDHAAPRTERTIAVRRWTDWYAQQQQKSPPGADQHGPLHSSDNESTQVRPSIAEGE